jgi:hypothetical protein
VVTRVWASVEVRSVDNQQKWSVIGPGQCG